MRKYILFALVLLVLGVGISLYLIPSEQEVVALQERDVEQVDIGNVDVEAEYAQGRRTLPIILGLAKKRVEEGNRPAAIALLEEYVTANPNDAAARKALAEQYQLAGDQKKYNEQLEAIAAAEPTEQNLKVLSDIYNAEKSYPKQIEVLQKLVEVTGGENPAYYSDLATIQMVENRSADALKSVEELRAKHPEFKNYATTRIVVAAKAEQGDKEGSKAEAEAWVAANPNAKELADLVNILHYTGKDAASAIALVEPRMDMLTQEPELVQAYVNANITAGREDHAYDILTRIDAAGTMPASLYGTYLEMAMKRDDAATAEAIVAKIDPTSFSEEQALNLLELARANDEQKILSGLIGRFSEPQSLDNRPVLSAVIAIITRDEAQDSKIEAALATDLSSTQRLRLAEACARAGKDACFDTIVKKFPPIEEMTPAQVAEYAQLFIIAERADEVVDAVGVKARANPVYETNHAFLRLAAASGRADLMQPWLESNGESAGIDQLQEYFYLANDRGHGNVSAQIAEILYKRDASPENRDIMVASILKSETPERALPLLRQSVTEGANDAVYLSTLNKVARKDAAYRKELVEYAQALLEAGRGTTQQQLNYAYILLNNGKRDVALPIVRTKAKTDGGEWKKMLAQLTPAPSRAVASKPAPKLTREQRVAMAKNPGMSVDSKRQLAFSLLNDGYKADAAVIFQELAANKGPDSQEVKDLLYIWGGKLDQNQMAWLSARAQAANAYDRPKWGALISNYASDEETLRFVSATPDALYNPALRQKFFRALAQRGSVATYDAEMRPWVAETNDIEALRDYARTGQDFGFKEAAKNGYQRILALAPNDRDALNRMGALSFTTGQFTQAKTLLDRAVAAPVEADAPVAGDAQSHFFRAELLKREGDKQAAGREYAKVVELENRAIQSGAQVGSDSYSRLYTSLFHLGRANEGKEGFERMLQQNPSDKSALADYMSVLLEYNMLDDATRIANQYDANSPYYQRRSSLNGTSRDVSSIQSFSRGREMKISFAKPIDGKSPILSKNRQWLEHAQADHDSVTLAAKPGYVLKFIPTSAEQFVVVPAPATVTSAQLEQQRQQDLRLQLLYARIEQQTGQNERARQRLAVLSQYYPNDPQLIAYRANVERTNGNPITALKLARQAQTLSPENEDLANLEREIRRGSNTNFIKLDHEYRSFGKSDEQITTLSGAARVSDRTEIGFNVKNDQLDAENIRDTQSGVIGNYDVDRQQGELYLAQYYDGGARAQASVFANNKTPGGGLYYAFNTFDTARSEVFAEYHRPYWDFVEAVYEHTTRDRVGARHTGLISKDTSFGFEGSVNRYNTDVTDNAIRTGLIRANIVHTLRDAQPYLGVGYGFDGEYTLGDRKTRTVAGIGEFAALPLVSREVHALTGILRHDLTPSTHAFLIGGWAYDRLGEQGPVVEGRLTQDVTDDVEVGVRARYGLQTNDSSNNAVNAGAHIQYKF